MPPQCIGKLRLNRVTVLEHFSHEMQRLFESHLASSALHSKFVIPPRGAVASETFMLTVVSGNVSGALEYAPGWTADVTAHGQDYRIGGGRRRGLVDSLGQNVANRWRSCPLNQLLPSNDD